MAYDMERSYARELNNYPATRDIKAKNFISYVELCQKRDVLWSSHIIPQKQTNLTS